VDDVGKRGGTAYYAASSGDMLSLYLPLGSGNDVFAGWFVLSFLRHFLFRQRVKASAHVAELPSFAQNRTGMHWIRSFLRTQEKRASDRLTSFRVFEGGVLDLPEIRTPPQNPANVHAAWYCVQLVGRDLAAPARVSPAPATEQKQHHENNQYGFHFVTSFVRGSGIGL